MPKWIWTSKVFWFRSIIISAVGHAPTAFWYIIMAAKGSRFSHPRMYRAFEVTRTSEV